MALFQKRIGPVFLKEESKVAKDIERLTQLSVKATGTLKEEIEKQIKILQYGQYGEECIAFELKNSGLDLYILHDIYIETGELAAQIDYVIVGRKQVYVLECKNLIGNIEVDNNGNFIRTYEIGGKKIKEGIYSPITQNQRHLQVIKEKGLARRNNIFAKAAFEKNFEKYYHSLIVLSNPRTVLNARYAKKEIKDKIIRADQLIAKIKEMEAVSKEPELTVDTMKEIAESLLKHHQENLSDYIKKFEEQAEKALAEVDVPELVETVVVVEPKVFREEADVTKIRRSPEELQVELKKFRLETSRAEGLKPYYIFTDAQMQDLIAKYPQNQEELLKVNGFGKAKVEKYGVNILEIFLSKR